MPALLIYGLKLSVCLGVVYLFYYLVLQNLTFYNWKRWYLLCFTALSFILPVVDISTFWKEPVNTPFPTVFDHFPAYKVDATTILKQSEQTGTNFLVWDWVLLVILSGSVLRIIITLMQFCSFQRIRRKAHLLSDHGVRIYQVNATIEPFSFGSSIFLNKTLHQKDNLLEIIKHELVHVRQLHTCDIIWMELICILNWFNPFAWLLRQQLRQNLEFIADHQVLASGTDKKHYQYLLLQVIGNSAFRLANQFNFSPLKTRIIMMNKIPSPQPHLAKFLLAIPLMGILLFSFRGVEKPANKINFAIGQNTQDKPSGKNEKRNFVNSKNIGDRKILVVFQDGTQEIYDTSTKEGVQKFAEAQMFMGDSYNPEDKSREWGKDFPLFLQSNTEIAALKWRYDLDQINKTNFVYPADRLFITLKSGIEEVYKIENKEDLAQVENKLGKLPMLPPAPPTVNIINFKK